jgi:hypothetical protein
MPLEKLTREVCERLLPMATTPTSQSLRLANHTFLRVTRDSILPDGWIVRVMSHDLILMHRRAPGHLVDDLDYYTVFAPPSPEEAHSLYLRRVHELTGAGIHGSVRTADRPAPRLWESGPGTLRSRAIYWRDGTLFSTASPWPVSFRSP